MMDRAMRSILSATRFTSATLLLMGLEVVRTTILASSWLLLSALLLGRELETAHIVPLRKVWARDVARVECKSGSFSTDSASPTIARWNCGTRHLSEDIDEDSQDAGVHRRRD